MRLRASEAVRRGAWLAVGRGQMWGARVGLERMLVGLLGRMLALALQGRVLRAIGLVLSLRVSILTC